MPHSCYLHSLFFFYTRFFRQAFHIGALIPQWFSVWDWRMVSVIGCCGLVVTNWDLCVKRTFVLAPHFELTAFICLFLSTHFQLCFFTCVTFPHLLFLTVSPIAHCLLCSDSLLSRLPQGHTEIHFTGNWPKKAYYFVLMLCWVFVTERYGSYFRDIFVLHPLTCRMALWNYTNYHWLSYEVIKAYLLKWGLYDL